MKIEVQPPTMVRPAVVELTAAGRVIATRMGVRYRANLEDALQLGAIIKKLKDTCNAGEYHPALEKIGISHQRASEYLRLHEGRIADPAIADADSIQSALEMLRKAKQAAAGNGTSASPQPPENPTAAGESEHEPGDDTGQEEQGEAQEEAVKLFDPTGGEDGSVPTPREEMKAVKAKIESFCRGLKKYVEANLPNDYWLRHNGVRDGALRKFQDGCGMLRSKKCAGVCPKCDRGKDPRGEECPYCHGTGRLPKLNLEST
jgi:hypothetical protein